MLVPEILLQTIAKQEAFLQLDPGNVGLGMELGDLYQEAWQLDKAVVRYKACLALNPEHAPARSRLASVLLSQHRFADAERMLRELLDAGESAPELQHNLGLALYFQERWDDAQHCFARAARAGLVQPATFAYWARSLRQLGHVAAAIAPCQRWLELTTGTDVEREAKGYLAELHLDGGSAEQAQRLAREILSVYPSDALAHVVLGVLAVTKQDSVEATQQFEQALAEDPNQARAWQGLGLTRLNELQLPKAIDALEHAVSISSVGLGSLLALGWAKLFSDDLVGAQEVFERALEVDRNFGESHGGLAAVLALTGDAERAEREFRVARRLNPGCFGADFAEATLLAAKGQEEASQNVFSIALKRGLPGGGMLLDRLRTSVLKRAGQLH